MTKETKITADEAVENLKLEKSTALRISQTQN